MEEQQRKFSGIWIPNEIYLDENLSALDKFIFAEINSLDNPKTHCIASNKYLANFCKCSERQISASISKLLELKYITLISFDGRVRTLKSNLKLIIDDTETF